MWWGLRGASRQSCVAWHLERGRTSVSESPCWPSSHLCQRGARSCSPRMSGTHLLSPLFFFFCKHYIHPMKESFLSGSCLYSSSKYRYDGIFLSYRIVNLPFPLLCPTVDWTWHLIHFGFSFRLLPQLSFPHKRSFTVLGRDFMALSWIPCYSSFGVFVILIPFSLVSSICCFPHLGV